MKNVDILDEERKQNGENALDGIFFAKKKKK